MKYEVLHGYGQIRTVKVQGLETAVHGPIEIKSGIEVECPCAKHTVKVDFVGAGKGTREYRPSWDEDGKLTVEGPIQSSCGQLFQIVSGVIESVAEDKPAS